MQLPAGQVTFLFTDIEGSTRLWEEYPDEMRLALARHDEILRREIERQDGAVFKTVGDAFYAVFTSAPRAVHAAIHAHLALKDQEWGEIGRIVVRIGVHTGLAEQRDSDYFGPTLNRVARLQGVGHGSQTLLSQSTYELMSGFLPDDVSLIDLGMHRFKDLAAPEHVWQATHPSLPQTFPPLKSLDYLPTNLPQQLTSFIGREHEMSQIKDLLTKTRILTLTGSGGTGKTRLALQASAEVLDRYSDGVWLVELAALADPSLLPQAVADALNIRETPGEPVTKSLVSWFRDKQILLVLDNCEHVLDASARLVDALVRSCPNTRVLVSSREALGISGEISFRVPSLSLPPWPPLSSYTYSPSPIPIDKAGYTAERSASAKSVGEYESVRLFIERAAAVRPDFALTSQNAGCLASVCHRLDGIPLAIELAGARVRALSVEEIDTRLDNRFRLLTGGSRTALPRQQTLRALIDWSYDLLNDAEKAQLCRLSVFVGGWTLTAAESVCVGGPIAEWDVLDLLTSLVDKSLVVHEEPNGISRYRLLETVRQYSRDRLVESGDSAEVRQRHRQCFLSLALDAEQKLTGTDQGEWYRRLELEHENLRAALDWSLLDEESTDALRFCGALQRFWWTRGHLCEGREWCARVLGSPPAQLQTLERAKALNGAGGLAWIQGDFPGARVCFEESLAIQRQLGEQAGIAGSLGNLGSVAYSQGDYSSALTRHEESLAIQREIGDKRGAAASLLNLGNVALALGNYASACTYYGDSLVISREIGDQWSISATLNNLGGAASDHGDYAAAKTYLEESLSIKREIGDRANIAASLLNLGNVALARNETASARAFYEESLSIKREIGDLGSTTDSLAAFASLACKKSDWPLAAALLGAEESLRERLGSPVTPAERDAREQEVTVVRKAMGGDAFAAAWSGGMEMTTEEAIALALKDPSA